MKYPYQNLALKNLKGERWEDIPELDGYFRISNFGRIKRMEYTMQYRNGAIYTKPEKIIRPYISKAANAFKKDITFFLTGRVVLHSKRYRFTIARLVYEVYVHPLDVSDRKMVVLTEDYDNFNIRPSNLRAVDLSCKQQRIFQRKRAVSPLLNLSESLKEKRRRAINRKISKKISQYSAAGRKLRTFASMADASRSTGIHAVSIASAAKGKTITAGRFGWAFGEEKSLDIQAIRKHRKTMHRKKYGFKISQYNFKGNKIAQFPSLQDAEEETGINAGHILLVVKGIYKSAYGFFWKRGYGKDKIDLSRHVWGRVSTALTQSKKVRQFSLEGKYLHTFASLKEAAQHIQVTVVGISAVLHRRQKSASGYIWKLG